MAGTTGEPNGVEPTSPDISTDTDEHKNHVEKDTVNSSQSNNVDDGHDEKGANGHLLPSHSDPSITPDGEAKDGGGKKGRKDRRRFVMNQRGFMEVQSMVTAKLVDEYQLLQVLGQGFYGKVYLGTSVNVGNGETVAIKQLEERKFQREQFEAISEEFRALHRIIHPNIVSYKRILLDDPNIYVVTEYMENGSIYDAIQKTGPMKELEIAKHVKLILNALSHLQDLKIVHRNLKCSNVLLAKNECKITDFELSHKHESNRYTIRGAPYWMAPEVIEMTSAPTCASDIWSLACMIVEMLTGEPPYRKLGPMSALLSISRDQKPPIPDGVSEYLRHFLNHCFAKDPEQRHDAKMLRKHPWVLQVDEPLPAPNGTAHHPPATAPMPTRANGTTPSPLSLSEPHIHPTPAPPTPIPQPQPTPAAPISSSPNASPAVPSPLAAATSKLDPPMPLLPSPPSLPHPHPRTATAPPPMSLTPPSPALSSQSSTGLQQSMSGQNIVIDVYSEKDKEDFDLLEMNSFSEGRDTPQSIDEQFQFARSNSFTAPAGKSELEALRAEVAFLRGLNDKNVESALQLREKFKTNLDIENRLLDLAWRLRERSDLAMDNIRQAAKATAHSNLLLKRTNQVATEALAHGNIVIANTRKLEEYLLELDPAGKKLMNIVFKKSITAEGLVNPTISGYLSYNSNTKTWKKDKEKRAWFVLKDNFLFAFKTDKGNTPSELVYLGEGARLFPMSEDQCKRKFCFRVADLFLIATDTAEQCSEWMLALSRPQKWYESSYEDPISPRIPRTQSEKDRLGSESSSPALGFLPPTPDTPLPPLPQTPSNKSLKQRRGSTSTGKDHHGPPVFGVPIEELFAREGGNVPYFFARMIQFLEEKALTEEGILRLSGSLSEINAMKDAVHHGEDVDFSTHDPHAVAGLLKAFFRELPAPIIPDPYHSRILEVMFNQEVLDDQRVVEVKMILDQLPSPNRAILKRLMNFLVKVNCNADKNKMTIQNLITCMVPTLKCVPGVFMYVIPNYDFVFDVE